jgi:leucyl-tRNA synthetase
VAQFLQMLSPIAPHIAEELWEKLGRTETISYSEWPAYEEAWTVDQEVEIVVQVNGKIVERVSIAADTNEADMEALAKELEKVQELIAGKTIRKVVAVKGKLVNIVAN